jgi:hypothetical protein
MLADALTYAAILVILFARTATKHAPLGLKQQERAAGVAP